jgi:hypothetical protein
MDMYDDALLCSDERTGSQPHSLVKASVGTRSCMVTASGFLEMLKSLPDGTTEASIQAVLEMSSEHAESGAIA